MHVEREREGAFQRYERIYQIVDYGALTSEGISMLEQKDVQVTQRRLGEGEELSFPLYPLPGFTEKLNWLEENSALRRVIVESLMLSVIIATKRIAERGGRPLQVLVNRQLLEYRRMTRENKLSGTKALAYEARVSNLYWSVYKTMLRVSGLDFKSRVRDRFVREFVQSIRARARGYSPANAGINYLHQRRLVRCRIANARAGIGWIGCEGIIHVAKREPSIGLLLDLSDSFKLADRESFLNASLRFEMSREEFVASLGRQRVWFYYPSHEAVGRLETIGAEADRIQVNYQNKDLQLTQAYEEYAHSFVEAIQNKSLDLFYPFVYHEKEGGEWLESENLFPA